GAGMDEILLTEINAGVATVTLNRPRQMNALTADCAAASGRRSRRSAPTTPWPP
ncbi:hypothetical protein LDC_0594, partial [sediment metagenome]